MARRFVQQQDGSAAVEFSLVAVPFLGLTFSILETALVFFAGQTLETAVADSAYGHSAAVGSNVHEPAYLATGLRQQDLLLKPIVYYEKSDQDPASGAA